MSLALLLGLGLGFVSGFGGPGYEVALVYGVVLASLIAPLCARDALAAELEPFDQLARASTFGALVFGAAALPSLLHGLVRGFCDLGAGLEILILGPGPGALLAGVWGALSAELVRARVGPGRWRGMLVVVAALAGPLGSIAISVGRFYTSPMIFAYDPFVGYFSGSLYDTVLDYSRLYSYRFGTACTLIVLVVVALHAARHQGRLRLRWIRRPGTLAVGMGALIASVAITVRGSALDHFHTRTTIEEALGGRIDGERCVVIHARSLKRVDVRRFAAECEAHVQVNEAWWGARGPEKITAFLFEDEAQKARLMGAAGTNIAKPWRAEIYVQTSSYPHRVLGHELMHVIAARSARGPFRVAGSAFGLLPNPGLIEGVAVAASPKDEDLTPLEWAKVMKDLGILPPLERLFSLGFIGENSSMAYTVSGAFIGFLHDRYGNGAVRRWYAGEDLALVTGKNLLQLELEFHAELDTFSLPEAAQIQGRSKFDRPGFFARRCPRFVDACRERAASLEAAGDFAGALSEIERARVFEPDNPSLTLERAQLSLARSQDKGPLEELARSEDVPRHVRDRAIEVLADDALSRGEVVGARARYEELLDRTFDESKLRTLYVKIAGAVEPDLRRALVLLLLGEPGKSPDRPAAFAQIGVLEVARPNDGLPPYLIGRYHVDNDDYAQALERLSRALAREITVPRVRAEALRLAILSATALADCERAAELLRVYEREPSVSAARRDTAGRMVERCWLFPAGWSTTESANPG